MENYGHMKNAESGEPMEPTEPTQPMQPTQPTGNVQPRSLQAYRVINRALEKKNGKLQPFTQAALAQENVMDNMWMKFYSLAYDC